MRDLMLVRVVASQEEGMDAGRYLQDIAHRLRREGVIQGGETRGYPRTRRSRSSEHDANVTPPAGAAGTVPQGVSAPTRDTRESAFGSVPTPPHLQGTGIETIIHEAREECAARITHD